MRKNQNLRKLNKNYSRGLEIVPFWVYPFDLGLKNQHQKAQAQSLRNVGGPEEQKLGRRL